MVCVKSWYNAHSDWLILVHYLHLHAFYHPDKIKFKENREFTKLYYKGIGTGQDKGNSQEETETFFDEQKSMHVQQRKQWVTFG